MKYKMEELVPIVGKLAEKYTSGESTSVTYEKAEQLMGAVIYCIRELQQPGRLRSRREMSAVQAYELGYQCVVDKVGVALALYNQITQDFDDYKNRCLHDTVIKGMPEFFKWYDPRFCPQDTILTLDYPVKKGVEKLQGIDAIYEYLKCIQLEQQFLGRFDREWVIQVLQSYDPEYEDMIDNLCDPVHRELVR